MPLEALIFDVDGTLAETEEVHRQAFNESFAHFGLAWVWPVYLYRKLLRVTGGKERIRHYVEGWQPAQAESALARVKEIHAEKNARYAALVERGAAVPRPGIMRLIEEARRQGLRLAIATTTSPENVAALLRATFGAESAAWFDVVGAGDCVKAKKPAPDIYHYVLDRLGVPASACIAFEDSGNGVLAARAAGLAVVATPSFYGSEDDFSAANLVVSDLGEPTASCRPISGPMRGDFVDLACLRGLLERVPV